MTTEELCARLRMQAEAERGSSTVWHEADIDGHHLYMADTSFGDGPVFRYDKHLWQIAYNDAPITKGTTTEHLAEALWLAERAVWRSRFESLEGAEAVSTLRQRLVADIAGVKGDLSRTQDAFSAGGDLMQAAAQLEAEAERLSAIASRMGRISRDALMKVLEEKQ